MSNVNHARPAATTRTRVTIEGYARDLGGGVIRLWPNGQDASLTFDTAAPGITHESLRAPWSFSPGDIIAGDAAYVRDSRGTWRGSLGGVQLTWSDAEVADVLDKNAADMELLRYKADPSRTRYAGAVS